LLLDDGLSCVQIGKVLYLDDDTVRNWHKPYQSGGLGLLTTFDWKGGLTFLNTAQQSLKQKAVYLHEITDGFQAKRIIENWIGFYNSERPHTALDKRPPDIAYFEQAETQKAA
jgi:acyl-CoA synthetase (AMP-forming)/AMP-acid ligase II